MVYWSRISTKIHASLDGVLKIEHLGANFLGLRLFITLSLPIGKPLRTWTNRIRRFRWVKDSRIAAWTYTFSTRKWNLDVAFLKMQWTDFWIAEFLELFICSLTENFPLLYTLIGPCRKAKITEIRSFLTPITAKSNSTILHHDTRENKLQRTIKKAGNSRFIELTWLSLQCLQWCVCFHYSRRILLSLGSVLEFRYQSLTLKYIEIGLLFALGSVNIVE